MKVYTGQIAKAKKHPNFIDITVKSGMKEFAPTWDMVMGHKSGKMSDEEYITKYYELMRASWKNNKKKWIELLNREEVVLGCYCRSGKFCHRYILVRIFRTLCKSLDIPFEYCGEIE